MKRFFGDLEKVIKVMLICVAIFLTGVTVNQAGGLKETADVFIGALGRKLVGITNPLKPTTAYAMDLEELKIVRQEIETNNSARQNFDSYQNTLYGLRRDTINSLKAENILHRWNGVLGEPQHTAEMIYMRNIVTIDDYITNELWETPIYVQGVVTKIYKIENIFEYLYGYYDEEMLYEWGMASLAEAQFTKLLVKYNDELVNVIVADEQISAHKVREDHFIEIVGYVEYTIDGEYYVEGSSLDLLVNYEHGNGIVDITRGEKVLFNSTYNMLRNGLRLNPDTKKFEHYLYQFQMLVDINAINPKIDTIPVSIKEMKRFGRRIEIDFRFSTTTYHDGIYDKLIIYPDATVALYQNYVGLNGKNPKETPALRITVGYHDDVWKKLFYEYSF